MMELNKKDLKKIIYDFNSKSNRLLHSYFEDYSKNLTVFLRFICDNPLIYSYIKKCGEPNINVEEEVERVKMSYGSEIFNIGETEEEETSNVFAILMYLREESISIPYSVGLSYVHGSTRYQDGIDGFNQRFVMILIQNIENYLSKLAIDLGVGENSTMNIDVKNGQVNIAQDNAKIEAHNVIRDFPDNKELDKLIKAVRDTYQASDNHEELESINVSLDIIKEEILKKKPRKEYINTALSLLKSINNTTQFAAAVTAIAGFVVPYI